MYRDRFLSLIRRWPALVVLAVAGVFWAASAPSAVGQAIEYNPEPLAVLGPGPGERFTLSLEVLTTADPQSVIAAAISPDGRLVASLSAKDGEVSLWDAITRKEVETINFTKSGKHYTGKTGAIAFHPDGNSLAILLDGQLLVWKLHAKDFNGPILFQVAAIAFSPDGKELATVVPAEADNAEGATIEVYVWKFEGMLTGEAKATRIPFKEHDLATTRILLGGKNNSILVIASTAVGDASRAGLTIWDRSWNAGDVFTPLSTPTIGWSADCKTMIAGDQLIAVKEDSLGFEVETKLITKLLTSTGEPIRSKGAVFSGDGRWVVAGDSDGQLRFYDAKTGDLWTSYEAPLGAIHVLAASPDGKLVVTEVSGVLGFLSVTVN